MGAMFLQTVAPWETHGLQRFHHMVACLLEVQPGMLSLLFDTNTVIQKPHLLYLSLMPLYKAVRGFQLTSSTAALMRTCTSRASRPVQNLQDRWLMGGKACE